MLGTAQIRARSAGKLVAGIPMKILMVLTSHDALGDSGEKTGFWLEEFAAPYYAFMDAGALVTIASPLGAEPPIDPRSETEASKTEATRRLKSDPRAQALLASTVRLTDVVAEDFDAVFYPGGHGSLWDLSEDPASIALIEAMLAGGKPAAFVCHAPGVLRHARVPDGASIVDGREVTGFADTEEARDRADRRCSLPRRGHAAEERGPVHESRGLGAACGRRRNADQDRKSVV